MFSLCCTPRSWGVAFVFAFLYSALVGGVARGASADDITRNIADLTKSIKEYDEKALVAPNVVTDLRKLLLDKKLIGPNAAPAFIEISTEVQAILNDEKSRNQIAANKDGPASAKALFDSLVKISDDMIVKDRFGDLLDKITSIIIAPAGGAAPAAIILSNQAVLRAAILEKPATPTALQTSRANFDKAWAAITEDYKIHVLRSWFGDLRTHWREGRLCAATSTIMTKCEAQTECKLDAAPAATQPNNQYDQLSLCGYDPAPLVDPDFKGVATEFTCVRGGKDIWDALARQPGINPETGGPWDSEDLNVATLRSSAMSFRCPSPAKTAAPGK